MTRLNLLAKDQMSFVASTDLAHRKALQDRSPGDRRVASYGWVIFARYGRGSR